MIPNLEDGNKDLIPNVCPHLALKDDVESYAAFPSTINVCNYGHYSATPKISHQRSFCLSQYYKNCKVFKSEETQKFPKEIKYKSHLWLGYRKINLFLGVFGICLFLIIITIIFRKGFGNQLVGFVGFQTQMNMSSSTTEDDRVVLTNSIQMTEIDETEINSQSTQALPTKSPEILTPTKIDPILTLDTPIGGEYKFIIHRVLEGESLQYYSDLFGTTPEAILLVNDNLVTPLWVDWIVIIPVNLDDTASVPAFIGYQVEEEEISAIALAKKLSIPVEGLIFYNDIDEEYILHKGEWLLIPRN